MKTIPSIISKDDPRYAEAIAQWDYRYGCIKSKADTLRGLGVPPPPITAEGLAWVEQMQAEQAEYAAKRGAAAVSPAR